MIELEVLTHILSHLPPPSLSSTALVSRRFHSLVTTPHAWRIAFSRYFPGSLSLRKDGQLSDDQLDRLAVDRRYFARLTALASWRSEYILRTRLLRSLSRGKPMQLEPSKKNGTVRSTNVRNGSAVSTYPSQLLFPISHLGASFSTKREPLFIHGAANQGIASISDPSFVKVGTWGLSDHQFFRHFEDLFPGEPEYGLGSGDLVGKPNCMDVSQPFGMIYGEGCPQGRTYFISSTEHRGRFLDISDSISQPHLGIPALNMITTSVCSVWIAKSTNVLKITGGLIGMLSGSSSGVLTAYALGPHPTYTTRFERGQVTAKWVLSPGVPIIAIAVDDNYSLERHARRRIWAVALNALGEVFYLTDIPKQPEVTTRLSSAELDQLAWKTGRSARWEFVEPSRRAARPDPFSRGLVDGSYSPRSSSDSMNLDSPRIAAETRRIEAFLALKPKHFRKKCQSWDMRRDLVVDFAGDDANGAGESIIVVARGIGEDEKASIRRYMRRNVKSEPLPSSTTQKADSEDANPPTSIFGGPASVDSPATISQRKSGDTGSSACSPGNSEWSITDFGFADRKSVQITSAALDLSAYSLLTADEDPLLSESTPSSPMPHMEQSSTSEVPGRRARYMAVGTAMGTVFLWDIRSPTSQSRESINTIAPLRIIQTESPQVTCVALTSLYLVHGGNDGLVQAWDPLASTTDPIRTLNSRFSSRARRRLVQAEASILGVGNNYFAAGAICLDPDPTVLRGMVALGTHLRYWSYSSTTADQYKSNKRRLRRHLRGNNNSPPDGQRYNSTGRGTIQDFIEEEKSDMERQKVADEKEKKYLNARFGIDLLGEDVGEDQLLAYAQLISEESYTSEAVRRGEVAVADSSVVSTSPSDALGRNDDSFGPGEASSSSSPPLPYQDAFGDDLEPDIAEAIRLSLLEGNHNENVSPSPGPVDASSSSASVGVAQGCSPSEPPIPESSQQRELDDLNLALQLSLVDVEEEGREQEQEIIASVAEQEEFPVVGASLQQAEPQFHVRSPRRNKGKSRA